MHTNVSENVTIETIMMMPFESTEIIIGNHCDEMEARAHRIQLATNTQKENDRMF